MSDIIELAEAALTLSSRLPADDPLRQAVRELVSGATEIVAELKAERAKNERLQTMVDTLRDDVEFYKDQRGMWER